MNETTPSRMTGITLLLPITLTTMAVLLLTPVMPDMLWAFEGVPGHAWLVPMVRTTPALCIAVLCPFASVLGDRFGRRRLFLVSMMTFSAIV